MSLRRPTFWIALCSAALVAVAAFSQVERESPGPISLVHQRIPELQEQGCAACHGGWFSDMTQACLSCHEPVAQQRADGTGVHGTLPEGTSQPCAFCHSDHHGEEFQLVQNSSFALAGFRGGVEGFDHARIGFEMAGAHLKLACRECHEHADAVVLPEGEPRYVGLRQDCASCHDDPHAGAMVRGCAECHTQRAFDELQAPFHDLPLGGGHGALACASCHADEGATSVRALGAVGPEVAVRGRSCQGCHDSPHGAGFLWALAAPGPESAPGGLGGRRACAGCHQPEDGAFLAARGTMDRDRHRVTGMALDGPHAELECAACHDPDEPFDQRFRGRRGEDCAQCHASPHGGQFGGNPENARLLDALPVGMEVVRGTGAACIDCHGRERFAPHGFDAALHRERGIPLDGAHDLDCASCHPRANGGGAAGIAQFRGIGRRCEDCHGDAHRGAFEPHAQELDILVDGTCSQCHQPTEFAGVEGFDHERWTGFAVDGAHLEAGCESCHPRSDAADELGRTLGFVREHFGAWEGCHSCHQDPHGGTFAVGGATRCDRCHDATSFRLLPRPFDHGVATGFALRGAHGGVDCSACHTPRHGAAMGERSAARARGRACASCHEDVHGGQFDPDPSTGEKADCSACHSDAAGWQDLVFVHERDTRMDLRDAHAKLDCAACHKRELVEGEERVRFRPMDPSCTACHGVQQDPLKRRRGR